MKSMSPPLLPIHRVDTSSITDRGVYIVDITGLNMASRATIFYGTVCLFLSALMWIVASSSTEHSSGSLLQSS